jgi:hypothetical protein
MTITWPDRGRKRSYWRNILVGVDQGIGTWWGIDCDETVSSYIGRTAYDSWRRKLIDWIFLKITGEKNHCLNNIEGIM